MNEDRRIMKSYEQLLDMLYAQFGETCNITLYSISNGKGKVVGTRGNMLAEQIGDPMPDYILKEYPEAKRTPQKAFGFINRQVPGFLLRTSLKFITGENDELIGCLSISHNLMQIKMIMSFLEEFYRSDSYLKENEPAADPTAITSVQDFVSRTIDTFMNERLGGSDFARLPRIEKLKLIEELERKGIFQVKGSVEIIAKKVSLTKFSIYNYLDEIRTGDEK
ncbi:MAG: helix-turn-helix domain-containing protein [Clostridia bacterium]|nr:helix-turn-helix domain-containing protein [Clostridia bacterium]